jgi:eight-cysteine-cluster-containing protein
MKEITPKRIILALLAIVLIVAAAFALQNKYLLGVDTDKPKQIELPEKFISDIKSNNYADEITSIEYTSIDGKKMLLINGSRKSLIGTSDYTEKVQIWIDESNDYIWNVEVVSREEEKCNSDSDCITGGPSSEVCALKEVLPKIKFSQNTTDASDCSKLSKCRCIGGLCRWEPNKLFEECLAKKIKGDIDV